MRKAVNDPVYRHRLVQLLVDAGLVGLAYWLAFALRFDQGIPERYSDLLWTTIAFVVVGKVLIFAAFGMYEKWWRYVGLRDFESILKAVVVASLVMVGVLYVWSPTDSDLPRSIAVMDGLMTLALIGGVRLAIRSFVERPPRGAVLPKGQEVLIVGAGEGGQLVAKEMLRTTVATPDADRVRRRRSAQARHAHPRAEGAGHHDRARPRCSTTSSPTR